MHLYKRHFPSFRLIVFTHELRGFKAIGGSTPGHKLFSKYAPSKPETHWTDEVLA